eukprot:TRINITY_DN2028_c0_g1_i1.p2 TRINITY_DN2028_c0_g1~~TRINITY_DN2028_c0_g1_i1.p2  ORF type:complete len:105 (-),score=14.25 TRINITY_DN2028_c0_g1_i1:469-783(-)
MAMCDASYAAQTHTNVVHATHHSYRHSTISKKDTHAHTHSPTHHQTPEHHTQTNALTMAFHGPCYGLDAEMKSKNESKLDPSLLAQATEYISQKNWTTNHGFPC